MASRRQPGHVAISAMHLTSIAAILFTEDQCDVKSARSGEVGKDERFSDGDGLLANLTYSPSVYRRCPRLRSKHKP